MSVHRPSHRKAWPCLVALLAAVVTALVTGCSRNGSEPGDLDIGRAAASGGALGVDTGRTASLSTCTGTVGAHPVFALHVPPGATCRLLGTTVMGDVLVGRDARLVVRRAMVRGDVIGRGARRVLVTSRSVIGGSVVLTHGRSGTIGTARIHGDLGWFMQTGLGTVRRSVIRGDLVAGRTIGRLIITANRIGGDLRCHQNLRVPIHETNLIGGRRLGQCASIPLRGTGRWSQGQRRRDQPVPPPRWRSPCAGDSVSDDPSDDDCRDD